MSGSAGGLPGTTEAKEIVWQSHPLRVKNVCNGPATAKPSSNPCAIPRVKRLPRIWALVVGRFARGGIRRSTPAASIASARRRSTRELKALLKASDGNLSVHARKLEEADYIVCAKSFDGRTPKTEYRLTVAGRKALERYLNHMEALIRATREG